MLKSRKNTDPFKARLSYSSQDDPLFKRWLMGSVEYATGRKKLEKVYSKVKKLNPGNGEVWRVILDELEVSMLFDEDQLRKVPETGPVVVIANHPFGVVDGLILGYLLARMRQRFFVLVNEVLCREELLAPYFLPIDFRDTREALQINIQTRQLAADRLRAGEIMGIFPAGGVATAPGIWKKAEDLEWKRFVVKLIRQAEASVLPLYIHGRNSRLFQLASQVSLDLRLSLLLNEVRNKIGKKVLISVGELIPFARLAPLKERQEMLNYLRGETEALSNKIPDIV